jgi:hypothetical protein
MFASKVDQFYQKVSLHFHHDYFSSRVALHPTNNSILTTFHSKSDIIELQNAFFRQVNIYLEVSIAMTNPETQHTALEAVHFPHRRR